MSTTLLKTAAIAAITVAGLATTAHAQSRYGDIYEYEGAGANCVQPCAPVAPAAPAVASRYGSVETVAPAYGAPPVIVDCSVFGTPGCGAPVISQPTTVYTQPMAQAQTYSEPTVTMYENTSSYGTQTANCPAGTTMQSDGTCLQGSSYSATSSYSSSSSYSTGTTQMADCPAGSTKQPDGSCMQSSYSSGTSYSSTTTMADCPMGTTRQVDGTCATSRTVYTGDATPSYGYGNDGSYGADVYRPIRK